MKKNLNLKIQVDKWNYTREKNGIIMLQSKQKEIVCEDYLNPVILKKNH